MAPRKRAFSEVDAPEVPKEMGLLEKIRNMYEFAAIMQFLVFFGDALKIDKDFDINDFEDECMKPEPSDKLEDLGLTLLKWISSHRGLTLEIWDEYTRRQYWAKAPSKNPYGEEELPRKFREFDIFSKIKVLHQLTVWTLWNPDRMRERMPEQGEAAQTEWRIEEFGWDRDDRTYYLFDDNRLYRRTDPPLPTDPTWKPKSNTLKAQAARKRGRRESKRRRLRGDSSPEPADDEDEDEDMGLEDEPETEKRDDTDAEGGLGGGFKWECICITLQQFKDFVETHRKSRDPNEKSLVNRIVDDVMPVLEKAEEAQLRKMQRRERELQAMEKLAHAKRSSRLAGKHEKERIEREQEEANKKRYADLAAARKMEEDQKKIQEERQYRMMTREQRIREREYKRLLHEEELARMEAEAQKIESGEKARGSRHLQATIEKTKKDLEELQNEDEWMFDCAGCGMHGKNLDDGEHSIQCEKCNVWQHSKCHGISQADAESDDFHFICKDCRQKEEDARKPKIPPLKFRVGTSSSPPAEPAPIEVAKKPRGRPKKYPNSPTPAATLPPLTGNHMSAQQSPRQVANGIESPQQFRPQEQFYPAPSPVKPSPSRQNGHPNGIFRASPYQQQIMSHVLPAANGSANHTPNTVQMSPPSQPHNNMRYYVPPNSRDQRTSNNLVNGTPYQPRPSSSSSTQATAGTPAPARNVSPLQNLPSMSPTQGNLEVGPLAGVPTPKPNQTYMSPPPVPVTPQPFGTHTPNGIADPSSHQQSTSQSPINPALSTPLVNHMSGRSPTKHSPPPNVASFEQSSRLPSGSQSQPSTRSVSGTPIFPPTSTLAPSPKQLDKTPVPTPSKQMTPLKQGDAELARVVGDTTDLVRDQVERQQAVDQPIYEMTIDDAEGGIL